MPRCQSVSVGISRCLDGGRCQSNTHFFIKNNKFYTRTDDFLLQIMWVSVSLCVGRSRSVSVGASMSLCWSMASWHRLA
jgi:hypothetical protein